MDDELGTLRRVNGTLQGKLERAIEHDQHAVWNMLTAPERLVEWLAPGSIELRIGGRAKLNFIESGTVIDSVVTAIDPPQLIEYSWSSPGEPSRPLRWQTWAVETGTRLTLLVSVPQNEDIARACAGWEAHLMMLMAAMEGVPIKFPFERFKRTREAYNAKLNLLRVDGQQASRP